MRFVTLSEVAESIRGKSVALVGSSPSVLDNAEGYIDSHDIVVRVNNYKLQGAATGGRTDIHYSFYGSSVRKDRTSLLYDGVKICMCKCPNGKPIDSEWHVRMGKLAGIDFRYIYEARKAWWFCDTYIPTEEHFQKTFKLLNGHIPTTGFSAILDILLCEPKKLYLTGFDFFESGLHNVDEAWRPGDSSDPIAHRPDLEKKWIAENLLTYPLELDPCLLTKIKSIQTI